MDSKTTVWVTTSFVGFHKWENAPEEVSFLRHYHRHVFHVKLGVSVSHNDRDVEFFTLKKELDQFVKGVYELRKYFLDSCEQIAQSILEHFKNSVFVEVSEDAENGARVERAS